MSDETAGADRYGDWCAALWQAMAVMVPIPRGDMARKPDYKWMGRGVILGRRTELQENGGRPLHATSGCGLLAMDQSLNIRE